MRLPFVITCLQVATLIAQIAMIGSLHFPSSARIVTVLVFALCPLTLAQLFISKRESGALSIIAGSFNLGISSQVVLQNFIRNHDGAFRLGVDYAIIYFLLQLCWVTLFNWFRHVQRRGQAVSSV